MLVKAIVVAGTQFWSAQFWSARIKLGVGSISCLVDFALPPCLCSATMNVSMHLMMCVSHNFLSASIVQCLPPICACVNLPLVWKSCCHQSYPSHDSCDDTLLILWSGASSTCYIIGLVGGQVNLSAYITNNRQYYRYPGAYFTIELSSIIALKFHRNLILIFPLLGIRYTIVIPPFDGLIQGRHNSIANALELRLSCTNPSMLLYCTWGQNFPCVVMYHEKWFDSQKWDRSRTLSNFNC